MASPRANPALIGAFVVGAFALAAASVVVFGSGRMLQERTEFVTYFENPVTGLDVGSPVIFHGVRIGEVTKIDTIVDTDTFEMLARVYFETVDDRIETVGSGDLDDIDALVRFIEEGLRTQLKSQSLITGKLYLDLARHPDSEPVLHGLDLGTLEIPSIPTSLQLLGRQLRELADRVKALPLEAIVDDLAATLSGLNTLVNEGGARDAIKHLNASLKRAESLLTRLDSRSEGVLDELEGSVREFRDTASVASQTLTAVQASVEPGSALHQQLMETLLELQATLRSLRTLADQVSEQPEQVIFGRPEEEVK
ncbi:MAG: MCE family protein [Deltaproteobacteria bacterium]|nr:MCE family protein [Deltaproteobacteria bacterium]